MATSTDPRAAAFDATAFRDAIKFAMKLGAPQDTTLRATFRWTTVRTFTSADSGGDPWNFSDAAVTTTAHPDVQVDCAVEFIARATLAATGTAIGDFDTPRAIITVLDDDYTLIAGADQVVLGTNTYVINFVAPPNGLFGVTVYSIHATANDET